MPHILPSCLLTLLSSTESFFQLLVALVASNSATDYNRETAKMSRRILRIETCTYGNFKDHEIPTAGPRLKELFPSEELGNNWPLLADNSPPTPVDVQDNLDHQAVLWPVLHNPPNTCYRNAALAGLFNLAPFVNYLASQGLPPIFRDMLNLCWSFRNVDMVSPAERLSLYQQRVDAFWATINNGPNASTWMDWCQKPGNAVKGRKLTGTVQKQYLLEDSVEFLSWLFAKMEEQLLSAGSR